MVVMPPLECASMMRDTPMCTPLPLDAADAPEPALLALPLACAPRAQTLFFGVYQTMLRPKLSSREKPTLLLR